ncbi:MAG: hypothetical protein ACR2IE_02735 [Candidatus Sumerlaeaceae bacterium]
MINQTQFHDPKTSASDAAPLAADDCESGLSSALRNPQSKWPTQTNSKQE